MALCCTFVYTKNTCILAPAIKTNLQNKERGVLIGAELLVLTTDHVPLKLFTSVHLSMAPIAVLKISQHTSCIDSMLMKR